jgi:hypothetical protein
MSDRKISVHLSLASTQERSPKRGGDDVRVPYIPWRARQGLEGDSSGLEIVHRSEVPAKPSTAANLAD